MRLTSGLAVAGALLSLAGCSSSDPAAEAEPSEGPQATAPTEALATFPSVRPRNDARTILGPHGDLSLLSAEVLDDLEGLTSVNIDEAYGEPPELRLRYDVDATGRCSGEGEDHGIRFQFVTTRDGRMLASLADRPEGEWVDVSERYALADYCPGGVVDATLATVDGAGRAWPFEGAQRIGTDRIAGQRAVHFRKEEGGNTVDTWLAADGPDIRLLKLVNRVAGGGVRTAVFSDFDSAGPIAPEPPADQAVGPA